MAWLNKKKDDREGQIESQVVDANFKGQPIPEPPVFLKTDIKQKMPTSSVVEQKPLEKEAPKLTAEQERLNGIISYFNSNYANYIGFNDLSPLPQVVLDVQKMNLLIGVFSELVEIKELMREQNDLLIMLLKEAEK